MATPLSHRSARIGRRDVIKEKDMKKELDGSGVRRRSSSGVGGTPEDADYGLAQLFQPDNAPKMGVASEPGADAAEDAMVKSKFKVHNYNYVCVLSVQYLEYHLCDISGGVHWNMYLSRLHQAYSTPLSVLWRGLR